MSWGKWIVISFVLFAGFIGTLVTVCVRQDMSLVSKEYYQDELDYGKQVARLANTKTLPQPPAISVKSGKLIVEFVDFPKLTEGTLELFCPSNANFDKDYSIPVTAGSEQDFDISDVPHGMYKARMKWTMESKEYFVEEIVNL